MMMTKIGQTFPVNNNNKTYIVCFSMHICHFIDKPHHSQQRGILQNLCLCVLMYIVLKTNYLIKTC